MKKIILFCFISVLFFALGYLFAQQKNSIFLNSLNTKSEVNLLPFKKYSIPNLRKSEFNGGKIIIDKEIKKYSSFTSYLYYSYDGGQKVSGLINIPNQKGEYPIAILIRGYVDKEIYTTGVGTQRVGEFLAENGFITIAPDFLGYGKSDKAAINGLEERFQTYTTMLELIASLENLDTAFLKKEINITANIDRVVLWSHSNGGHIALTILEITGKTFPTVLWAPVSKPFPYSILFYTDEYSDRGKYLRKLLADFESDYDIEKYNPANYYQWIKAPIQIHQGINDESVPLEWSDELYEQLKKLEKDVDYFTYENADHNLMPDGWALAAKQMLSFYKK